MVAVTPAVVKFTVTASLLALLKLTLKTAFSPSVTAGASAMLTVSALEGSSNIVPNPVSSVIVNGVVLIGLVASLRITSKVSEDSKSSSSRVLTNISTLV